MPIHTDSDAIDVEFKEVVPDPVPSVEPKPCPGPEPLTRSDVLRCARSIQAQVVGMSGAIETAAFTPGRVRPEFMRAWHAWAGAFLSDAARLERVIFKCQTEAALLEKYGHRRDWWRQAIAAELGQTATVGAVKSTQNEPKKGTWAAPRSWPVWLWAPAGAGILVGSFLSMRWLFRRIWESVNDAGDREQSGEEK